MTFSHHSMRKTCVLLEMDEHLLNCSVPCARLSLQDVVCSHQAVRAMLASKEEKAAAAELNAKGPEQKEETEKEGKEEPRSDDMEERISSEVLDSSLQEMLQSVDLTEDYEGQWSLEWHGACVYCVTELECPNVK